MSMMVSACSTTKSANVSNRIEIPPLPYTLAQPCEDLLEISDTSAKTNLNWQFDTISKYNRCAQSKDALLQIYNQVQKGLKND